ncbi:hypothetical protein SSX86_017432 [Deinandra increscens subsp. villosa]|uniref:Protein TIFY n=1 Tax=Deinandra increscens subsp. villosa TaxID=3103831 RepID=A0AAP0D034_9ASTR
MHLTFLRRPQIMSAVEPNHPPPRPLKNRFHRSQSFRDIQSSIAKMNPEVVKTVIESGKRPLHLVDHLDHRCSSSDSFRMPSETCTFPLTIFYNGMVNVFQVPAFQAEAILKLAYEDEKPISPSTHQLQILKQGKPDFDESCSNPPRIARQRSLQRFIKKRSERFISYSLITCLIKL